MQKFFTIPMVAVALSVAASQAAAEFPEQPVTLVVPYSAGGSTDVVSRVLADELSKVWSQPVVVDNKPGGGTVVATAAVAQAPADGYTLLIASNAFTTNPAIRSNLPFDSAKDFVGITLFVDAPSAVAGNPDLPFDDLPGLIAEAKSRTDDPVTYAATLGGPSHMFAELLQAKTGITLEHIPYQGQSEAIPDVLAGRVDLYFGGWSAVQKHVESGGMKMIAVVSTDRAPGAPDAMTAGELVSELKGAPMGSWTGVVGPAGIPDDVLAALSDAFKQATTSESFREKVLALGSIPRFATPEETAAHLENELATWSEIATNAGIKLD